MAQCKLLLEFQGLPIKPGQLGSFDHLDSINKPLVESTRFIWVLNNFNGGMSLRIMRALKAPNTPEMNRYQGFWPAFILRGKGFVKHCLVDWGGSHFITPQPIRVDSIGERCTDYDIQSKARKFQHPISFQCWYSKRALRWAWKNAPQNGTRAPPGSKEVPHPLPPTEWPHPNGRRS